ncbi:hypothetical protein DFJ73DRAFT_757418 [Zopfochytrium polystomum]|nr:hypothetical protein DFJ73DRAFT_757418 [Zopfochytrium polystomum]
MARDSFTQHLTLFLFVYIAIVNSGFFVTTQWRIISVMKEIHRRNAPHSHYLDALLRGFLFVGATFLFNISVGITFVATTPSILFIVLLTDSGRIRKLVTDLQRGAAPPPAPVVVVPPPQPVLQMNAFPPAAVRAQHSPLKVSRY